MGLNQDSLGYKDLLQPAFGATLARAIRTLIEYIIFAHSAPGRTRTRTINTANWKDNGAQVPKNGFF